jgi:bifunctional non-homologous end joining protein LigD
MLWRVRNSRGRPMNVPAAFIHPCQPIVAKQPPAGPGWAHELKHDGYRLQIHVRDGRGDAIF